MKQDVNLYQSGLLPRKEPLTAFGALCLLVAVLCVAGGLSLYWQHRTDSLEQGLERAHKRQEKLESEVARLREKADDRGLRDLRQKVRHLGARERARRELLDVISRSGASRHNDFAPFLRAMARQHLSRLWLTRFRIDLEGEPSLRLSGRTTESELIPEYLLRLSREEVFNGFTFRKLRAERLEDDPEILGFTLASETE